MQIAFLGGGNMAAALIGGLRAKDFAASQLTVVETDAQKRYALAARYGVRCIAAVDAAARTADLWVLAVKPQDLRAAVAPLEPVGKEQLVLSVAAGARLHDISRWLGGHRKLARAMPNTPALIGAGISALCALPEVLAADRGRAEMVLAAVGSVVWVDDERLLDPVTALSASGPAYVFWFIEQLAAAGEALGLPAAVAARLALETVLGAARLAAQSEDAPAVLRARVTSKGGTTEAALRVFDEERLAERLHRAIEAASRRGGELGDVLGRQ